MGVRTGVERRPVAGRTAAAGGWELPAEREHGREKEEKREKKRKGGKWVGPPNRSNLISTQLKNKTPRKIIPE